MPTLTFKVWNSDGNLADADTAPVLADSIGTYGIKRNDTGATVVAVDTAFTKSATGTYTYEFSAPATLVEYTAWIKVTYDRKVSYYEVIFTPPAVSLTFSTPADVMWYYLIDVASLFTDPSDDSAWPLYNDFLPDTADIDDDIAAVFCTAGVVHGKDSGGTLHQHYGIQLRVRAVDARDAYEKAKNVMNNLLTVQNQNVTVTGEGTYKLHSISQTTDIVPIDIDHKNRTHYTVNFIVAYTKQ